MEIVLNGAPHPLTEGESLQQLIVALELAGKAVAVAVNRQVVPARLWPQRILQPEDKVDVVRAIGGG
ncbi:sulfur carrier protein ThiS [Collimonas humicola]|uniref:sulfur carrier protein ThiS n=1 Tax=Collimonas humicola TaxID=2825886 RepID=UPI001B8B1808|nr:sulfur carrier protein ThiS [Collimonas humicola]